ncbi:MAG TPA: acyltransferase family protein [Deinococcales bacterium]|nr:acyltransferase family protein [Deinococcales bacterium]
MSSLSLQTPAGAPEAEEPGAPASGPAGASVPAGADRAFAAPAASAVIALPPLAVPGPVPAARPARLGAIDLFKGLAILEVLTHHVSANALSRLDPGSLAFFLVALGNRALHFAVPAFLFMTALVFMRSAMRPTWSVRDFYWSRVVKSLVPYLLWSGFYMLLRVRTTSLSLADLDLNQVWFWVLNGKASYHLYFLVVALQFYALFPLLVPLFRRRPSFPVVAAGALAVQLALYWANRLAWHAVFPGSLVIWYVIPIALGLHVGSVFETFGTWWNRNAKFVALAAVAGFSGYLPLAYQALLGLPVNTFAHEAFTWLFTSSCAILLFGFASFLARRNGPVIAGLRVLGQNSLQVYLLHPAVITLAAFLNFLPDRASLASHGPLLLAALAVPLSAALLVKGSALSRLLFGR